MRETMTKTALNAFRKALEKKQAELVKGNRNRESLAIATIPEELDRIQHATEREIAIGNLERDYNVLRDVNAALRRIDVHTFGICLDCEEEINPKRLTAIPWTRSCIACQEAADGSHKTTRTGIDTSLIVAA
jgi:DnaK suppressor protein